MNKLIKREDEITCKVCQSEGERLIFDDGTSQVHHPKQFNEKVQQYATPVCTEDENKQVVN